MQQLSKINRGATVSGNFYEVYSAFVLVYLLLINNQTNVIWSGGAVFLALPFLLVPEKILPLLFACSINSEFMVAFQGISMARIYTLIFLAGAIFQVFYRRKRLERNDILVYLFFSIFLLVSAATSFTEETTPAYSVILYFLMVFFMLSLSVDRQSFLKGCIIISVILSVYYAAVLLSGTEDALYGRVSVGETVNTNMLAMGIAQLLAFNFAAYFISEKRSTKLILIFSGLCNVLGILFTGSRSGAFGAVCAVFCCILLMGLKKNPRVKGIRPLTVVAFLLGTSLVLFLVQMIDPEVLSRFTLDNVVESGGTGRFEVWTTYLEKVFPRYPFFGLGYGGQNLSIYLTEYYGISQGAHNILIEMLSSFGIVGTMLFVPYLVICLAKVIGRYRLDKTVLIPFTMLCAILFNGIGENTFGTRILWFAVGLGLMLCRQPLEETAEKFN